MTLTDAQTTALDDLRRLSSSATVQVIDETVHDADLVVQVTLNTTAFGHVEGGLQVETRERLVIVITPGFPWVPPQVHVAHHRWAGFPHVLQGSRLCLYLDPATEWSPVSGVTGFLGRLWDWFADAVANRFDPATALYQPVGGVFHRTVGAPTIVVTDSIGELGSGFSIRSVILRVRTEHRLDLLAEDGKDAPADGFRGLLVVLSDDLPYGGGFYLSDLAVAVRGQDSRKQRKQLLNAVSNAARRLHEDGHLHVVIAVPHRHLKEQARFHLIGWRLPRSAVAKAVEAASHRHQPESPHPDDEPKVQWTYVDDLRAAVTTRRDHARPMNWFKDKRVELWGCGALGSWIAEFLVRAGVAKITLRDHGYVTAGLLVRQNFTELDVGRRKVEALASRLRAISDSVEVIEQPGLAQAALANVIDADLVVDCTVNTGVAVAIDQAQANGTIRIPVMQLATDNESATLGVLTVSNGSGAATTNAIDVALHHAVSSDRMLGPYLAFWNRNNHPSFTPTIGCSVPTFHGAAADASAVAAEALSLAAIALGRGLDAGYLFAAAQSPYSVPRVFSLPTESGMFA